MKLTIGGFDGMHIGHMELIKRSDAYLVIEKSSSLTPGFDRIEYSSRLLDIFYLEKIKDIQAEEFIEILKNFNTKKIIIGEDFRFGKDRKGDISLLKKTFEVEIIKEIKIENIGVHSHFIRKLLINKEIKKANKFLGHKYKIKGYKISDQGLGSKKLVPTINLIPFKPYILPTGVFATKTNNYKSITFIGKRSTDSNFSIETHILEDFEDSNFFEIEFVDFIRDNKKFKDLNNLLHQIKADIKQALQLLQ